jgi:hypothetical protein
VFCSQLSFDRVTWVSRLRLCCSIFLVSGTSPSCWHHDRFSGVHDHPFAIRSGGELFPFLCVGANEVIEPADAWTFSVLSSGCTFCSPHAHCPEMGPRIASILVTGIRNRNTFFLWALRFLLTIPGQSRELWDGHFVRTTLCAFKWISKIMTEPFDKCDVGEFPLNYSLIRLNISCTDPRLSLSDDCSS